MSVPARHAYSHSAFVGSRYPVLSKKSGYGSHDDRSQAESALRFQRRTLQNRYGSRHREQGRPHDALRLHAEELAIWQAAVGADHPQVVGTLVNTAAADSYTS